MAKGLGLPGTAFMAKGLDVSGYQKWGHAEWQAAWDAGYRFAFIKACEGTSQDKRFAEHWQNAKEVGFLRGAYGFVHVTYAIRPQAEALLDILAEHGRGELPPVIDIETAHGQSAEHITGDVAEWLDIVHQATETRPIVYTYANFSRAHMKAEQLAESPLWVAHYGVANPDHAHGWKRWDFWQWTGKGEIPGIKGHVDLNVYNGTLAELREAYVVTPTPR
jgi:lysozyme